MIHCEFENESKASLRHVTVKSIVVNKKGEILIIKRAPDMLRGNKYDLPGGYLDRDEDTKDAAIRELKEETGIDGIVESLFRINDDPKRRNEDRQNVEFIYIVKAEGDSFTMDHETISVGWFDQNNLPNDEEFAFDHLDSIVKYFEYLKSPFPLPIIG